MEKIRGEAVLAEVEDGTEEDAMGRALAEERHLHLRQALASLKPQHRSAIYLHYWLGHSVQEIAELLRVAPGTVKSYLHRARARLVPLLSEEVVR